MWLASDLIRVVGWLQTVNDLAYIRTIAAATQPEKGRHLTAFLAQGKVIHSVVCECLYLYDHFSTVDEAWYWSKFVLCSW